MFATNLMGITQMIDTGFLNEPTAKLAFGMPGTWEWVLLGGIALLVFGPKKLPQIGQAIGQSLREFKKAAEGVKDEFNKAAAEESEAEETKTTNSGYNKSSDGYGDSSEQYGDYDGGSIDNPVEDESDVSEENTTETTEKKNV